MPIWSSDWFLSTIPPHRIHSKNTPHSISQTLSLTTTSNTRLFIICTSKSPPPPLLEDTSNDLQIPSTSPIQQPATLSDVNISNEFICSLCKTTGTESLAFEYYQKAKQQPKFRPASKTLKLLMNGFARSKRWDLISSLVNDFKVFDAFPDAPACARVVGSCVRARKFKLSELLLGVIESKKKIAVPAFVSAMRSYNKLHMFKSTVSAYKQMTEGGLLPDSNAYCYVMDAHWNLGDTKKVIALFLEFESKSWDFVDSYPQIYLILCDSVGKSGRAFEALRYFREMLNKGILPNSYFYASLIGSFARLREAEIAEDLFEEGRGKGMIKDRAIFQNLAIMYVELGHLEKAIGVAKAMKDIGIRVSDCILSVIINGFVKKRGLRASVRAYEQLVSLGCKPGQVTYASIINVYCSLGLPKMAETVFLEMMEKGFDRCLVAYSNMISMYGKVGKVKDAMKLLAKMKEKGCAPNVWVYNSLIDMHGKLINIKKVEKIWKEMRRRNIAPDRVSYTSLISAYSKAREFEECLRIYQEFRMNGGKANRVLAGIMVGVFSKSNRIDELLKLLQELKSDGTGLDGRLYKSALNALRDAGLQAQLKWFETSFSIANNRT